MNRLFLSALTLTVLIFSIPFKVAWAEWRVVSHANEERYEMISVFHDDKLIILNGFNKQVDLVNSVEVYDYQSNDWTQLDSTEVGLQNAVTHAAQVVIDDELWVFGGRVGDHPGFVSDKVWIYHLKSHTWRPGPELPQPFAGGGASLVNNQIHLFGGLDKNANCDVDSHFVYNITTSDGWKDITNDARMPVARNHFSTVVFEDKIYALGGQHNHDNCPTGFTVEVVDAHVYDPSTNNWSELKDLPFPRSHSEPATFVHGDRIFIVGGRSNGKKVLSYHPASDSWKVESELELPVNLMAPAARIVDNKLYVAMGSENGLSHVSSAMRVLDLPQSYIVSAEDTSGAAIEYSGDIPTPTSPKFWTDSYAVDGQCYCDTTFDHSIGEILYPTPIGEKTVSQICNAIENNLGEGASYGRVYYNTVQCGHGPVNLDRIYDEWVCPGIPEKPGVYSGERCFETGAKWNLDRIYGTDNDATEDFPPIANETDGNSNASKIVYRVNAGGPVVYDSSGNWISDSEASKYVNTGTKWSHNADVNLDNLSVSVPSSLFDTERYDGSGGAAMHWAFPVEAGSYTVRLYFAETYQHTMSVGARKFDVIVEGKPVYDFDIFKEAGGDVAVVKTFVVTSNNKLDIQLARKTQNPAIKAIEILKNEKQREVDDQDSMDDQSSEEDRGSVEEQSSADDQSIVEDQSSVEDQSIVEDQSSVEDQSIKEDQSAEVVIVNKAPDVNAGTAADVVAGQFLTLAASVSDDGLPNNTLSHKWSVVSGPASATFANDSKLNTTVMFSEAGTYRLALKSSDGALANTDDFTVKVTEPVIIEEPPVIVDSAPSIAKVVYRINAGGPTVIDSGGNWQSDASSQQYVNTGFTWNNPVDIDLSGITASVPNSLFQSERWDHAGGAKLNWKLPVSPGTYTVNLYFSEIWSGAMSNGGRVFDVQVEDQNLSGIDVYSEAGANAAVKKSFTVNADQFLDIKFDHVTQNPSVKAIEVLSTQVVVETAVNPPVVIDEIQEIVEEVVMVADPPAVPVIPAVVTPVQHCIVYAGNLQDAKSKYQSSCSLPRKDCDPSADGGWACSSSNL